MNVKNYRTLSWQWHIKISDNWNWAFLFWVNFVLIQPVYFFFLKVNTIIIFILKNKDNNHIINCSLKNS